MKKLSAEARLVEQAAGAQAGGDWSAAAKLTAELRKRFPDNHVGYQIGASAARALRSFDEASAILTQAADRFADELWLADAQAWLALTRGDANEAQRLAAELRNRFPQQGAGYHIGATAARHLRLFDEASTILTEAAGRFASPPWVVAEQAALDLARADAEAWLALARGDANEAQRLAAELRNRFPQQGSGYHIGASAARALRLFDEASAILTEAADRFAGELWLTDARAWLALACGDAHEAQRLAAELRNRFPLQGAGYHIGASAARDLRLYDEASAILTEAAARFADELWVASAQADLAYARGEVEQARQLAADLRSRFPDSGAGYHLGASAARELRSFDEASALLAEAATRFPDELWVASDQAWLALTRGEANEARRLAAELRDRFPEQGAGYHLGVSAARDLRSFDEASAILAEAADRFADELWVAAAQAELAYSRGEAEQARQLAASLRDRFPDSGAGYRIGASAARDLRSFDEASAILAEAAVRFANDLWVSSDLAWLALSRGDANEARRLAAELRDRFPLQGAGYHLGASAARDLRLYDEASAILAEAAGRFADELWMTAAQAELAYACGEAEQARRLAANLRNRFPDNGVGYRIGASTARDLRSFDEASAVLTEAAARFADEIWLAGEQALLAHARGDAEQAIERLAALRAREPAEPSGYRIAVSLLRGLNRVAEAKAILEEAGSRFSSEAWYAQQSAELSNLSNLLVNRAEAESLIKTLGTDRGALSFPTRDQTQSFDKVVVIVGMHRAGTSLCAKIIKGLGFSLGGPLLRPLYDNPDGFQEHQEIHQCHEALFAHLGATWDTSWLVRPSIRQQLQGPEARQIIDRLKSVVVKELRASGGRWAFKDPRTACFLPLWSCIFEELGIEPLWVLAVRDPRAVAASLYARNRLPSAVGELLWVEHYLSALRYLGPRIAGIIHYEEWFLPEQDQLNRLANILGPLSLCDIERAAVSINSSLQHSMPSAAHNTLDITNEVYSWLRSDYISFGTLQGRADLVWTKLRDRTGYSC
jgi:predicted Zn-dependent protease